jgi:sulfatase modifying factor 1
MGSVAAFSGCKKGGSRSRHPSCSRAESITSRLCGGTISIVALGVLACSSSPNSNKGLGASGAAANGGTAADSAGSSASGSGAPASSDTGGISGVAGSPPIGMSSGGNAEGGSSGNAGVAAGNGGTANGDTPSCEGTNAGLKDCGTSGEDCCSSSLVPGGTYYRQYAFDSNGTAIQLAAPATVSEFRLDKYLVTVGRFRKYVDYLTSDAGAPPLPGAGKHAHLNGGQGLINSANSGNAPYELGWDAANWDQYVPAGADAQTAWGNTSIGTWTPSASGHENLPMLGMTWYDAYAFCIWDGGFLPSQAEWLYAAAGGEEQRKYPWGALEPGTANAYAIYNCLYPAGNKQCTNPITNVAPVGTATLGIGRWGQLDLQGDVPQLVLDLYVASYAIPCTDCAYAAGGLTFRVAMGTGYNSNEVENRTLPRSAIPAMPGYGGFRCARSP